MSELSIATAAPRPITLGGKEYYASPLTYRELGDFEQAAVAAYLAKVERAIVNFSPEQAAAWRERTADLAMRFSVTLRPARKLNQPPEGEEPSLVIDEDHPDTKAFKAFCDFSNSVEGAARYLWLMLRKNHPELTVEQTGLFLVEKNTMNNVVGQLNTVNGSGGKTSEGAGGGGEGEKKA